MLTDDAWGGDETVDIGDLKSPERKLVWVRVPPALLYFFFWLKSKRDGVDTIVLACCLSRPVVEDVAQV